jgi:hypothetical protein
MITFEYGTLDATNCYGGIETLICNNDAVWTEYDDGKYRASVCDSCKKEIESYVNNK